MKNKILTLTLALLTIAAAIALFRDTVENGQDFIVFWNTGRNLLAGAPLYSVARDGAMVFKYPPWIAPAFIPLALFPIGIAKIIWALLELGSLAYIFRWLASRANIRTSTLAISAISFWGIWAVHALDGQTVLLLLALSLMLWTPRKWMILFYVLSTKVFTLFPALVFSIRKLSLKKFAILILSVGAVFAALSLPSLIAEKNPMELLAHWRSAAASSGNSFDVTELRGRLNPSLPGFVLRTLGVPAQQTDADLKVALALTFILGFVWMRFSRHLSDQDFWLGSLALTPTIHPLPWIHLFVFAFPLSALVLDRAIRARKWGYTAGALFGLVLIAMSSDKIFGNLGTFFQQNSARSFGVILDIVLLIKMNRAGILANSSPINATLPV